MKTVFKIECESSKKAILRSKRGKRFDENSFYEAALPMIEYLDDNYGNRATVIISNTRIELLG